MSDAPVRYRSSDEDSDRWNRFRFRPDDIIISTRSKSGTTWVQMLCALLILGEPVPPRPLVELSPWLDWLVISEEQVLASLDSQTHRRFIKTHTPLDGIALSDDVTVITVARHPLDMALSLHHQSRNLDRDRIRLLTASDPGSAEDSPPTDNPARDDPAPVRADPGPERWLRDWIDWRGDVGDNLDSLPGVLHHLSLAWDRRDQPNMILLHYDDLLQDLPGQMERLARRLGIEVDRATIASLSEAATFDRMKTNSDMLAPDHLGVLKSRAAFFRAGTSGGGAAMLDAADLERYHRRAAELARADLLAWLHRP